jgi:hypothetical protein
LFIRSSPGYQQHGSKPRVSQKVSFGENEKFPTRNFPCAAQI